ncbi:hypothetical protein C8J57DRAFT_1342687 [Mycena rebaudengoi]|nr:hypothetical protein C8J57DRAFT_1342687 [Mycena rebaudengoi]
MSSDGVYSVQAATLDNTLGAVFLGVVVSSILFGVSSLQVYWYYHYYPNDSKLHKISVAVLWLLDTTHLVLIIFSPYHYGVTNFGHAERLQVVIWPIKLQTAINVVVLLMVHSLYAYRVWLLSGFHNGVIGYLVAAVVFAGFGIGVVLAYETYTVDMWPDASQISWAVECSFATSTSIDVLISIAMCYYLKKSKGKESQLNSRISTLMQYTLSCGIFTSVCSLACLITFILMPNTMVFLALTYLLTGLYMNSFMAMMNARQRYYRHDDSSIALSTPAITYGSRQQNSYPDPESVRAFLSHSPIKPNVLQPRDVKYDWVELPKHSVPPRILDVHGKVHPVHPYTNHW